MKFLLSAFVLVTFTIGCTRKLSTTKVMSYSISTTYGNSDESKTKFQNPILANGTIYCEFLIKTKLEVNRRFDTVTLTTHTTEHSKDDTIGIQFVNLKENRFVHINRFSQKYSVLSSGKFDTSRLGLNFSNSAMNPSNKNGNSKFPTRDTIIENVKYLYTDNRIKDSNGRDSTISKTYGLTQYKFKSPFSALGVDDLGYGMVAGMSIELVGKPDSYSILITQIKPASPGQRDLFNFFMSEFGWQ
jgi:hypothetical protein